MSMLRRRLVVLMFLFLTWAYVPTAFAFWMWTPETNKWINPKYVVKETPQEQLDLALGLYDSQDYKEAIKELRKLLKHYPKAVEAPEAQFYIGQSMEAQGELFEAFKAYQMAIDRYPFSERSAQIVQRQYDIGVDLLEGNAQKNGWKKAFSLNEDQVKDVFNAVIKNAPYGDLAPSAQYKIAMYLMEKQLYLEARDEFEKVINDYPASEWAKAAQYQIALVDSKRSTDAQYDQQVTQAAVAEFEEFVAENPDVQLSQEAKAQVMQLREKEAQNSFVVGEFYEKQKNYKAAKIYFRTVTDEYKDTTWAKKALIKLQLITHKD